MKIGRNTNLKAKTFHMMTRLKGLKSLDQIIKRQKQGVLSLQSLNGLSITKISNSRTNKPNLIHLLTISLQQENVETGLRHNKMDQQMVSEGFLAAIDLLLREFHWNLPQASLVTQNK